MLWSRERQRNRDRHTDSWKDGEYEYFIQDMRLEWLEKCKLNMNIFVEKKEERKKAEQRE